MDLQLPLLLGEYGPETWFLKINGPKFFKETSLKQNMLNCFKHVFIGTLDPFASRNHVLVPYSLNNHISKGNLKPFTLRNFVFGPIFL
jgi:hypothetical protein